MKILAASWGLLPADSQRSDRTARVVISSCPRNGAAQASEQCSELFPLSQQRRTPGAILEGTQQRGRHDGDDTLLQGQARCLTTDEKMVGPLSCGSAMQASTR